MGAAGSGGSIAQSSVCGAICLAVPSNLQHSFRSWSRMLHALLLPCQVVVGGSGIAKLRQVEVQVSRSSGSSSWLVSCCIHASSCLQFGLGAEGLNLTSLCCTDAI